MSSWTSVCLKLRIKKTDKKGMEEFVNLDLGSAQSVMFMAVLSVVLFCGCCYQFLKQLTKPIPVLNNTEFAKSALRVEKGYKVFAWGVLTGTFLVGLVISFSEVFLQL